MPIYEYVCRNCGEELEQLQRLSDDALTECPACGESTLKRKISAAGFRLSGGGWYETDFKSDGRRNLAGADKKDSSSDSASASSGGDNGKTDGSTAKAGKSDGDKTGKSSESKSKPAEKSSNSSKDSAKSKTAGNKASSSGS